MGEIFRVHLAYEGGRSDQPESVVVKLPSSFEESRAQGAPVMNERLVRFT